MVNEHLPPDLDALISLLDDPDSEAFRHVSEQISSLGPAAVPPLEAAWEHSFDPVMQKRIEEIVHHIQFSKLQNEIRLWKASEKRDLFSAYLIISKYQYPDLNEIKVKTQLDHLIRDTWLELNDNLTSLEKIKVLNHIFFKVYHFEASSRRSAIPENFFLNIMLESRMASPMSVGMLYLIVAQHLGIPLKGIDLPNHFVLAYTNQIEDGSVAGHDSLDVQFYINPSSQGTVFSLNQLNEYLKNAGLKLRERYYMPCSNVDILIRLIEELKTAYETSGKPEKSQELTILQDDLRENS